MTVLYDSGCALCCRARRWLQAQPQYVALEFVGAGTDRAKEKFPFLDPEDTLTEITVVADGGGVYRGAKAWLMCLWATRKHRGWALRLASPAMLPSVRRFVDWVSRRRHGYLWRDDPGAGRLKR